MSDTIDHQFITEPSKQKLLFATMMVILSCICFGTVPFFVKSLTDLGINSELIPFYRYFISALVFLPWLFAERIKIKVILWGIASGACLGIGWISYVEALKTAPVSTVGVIYMTYPIFTLMIARFWLKEVPQLRSIVASILILIAATLTLTEGAVKSQYFLALLMSFLAPISFGLCINILVNKLNDIPPMARVSSISLGALIGLCIIIVPKSIDQIIPSTSSILFLAVGIAIITATIPQYIYSSFAPQIGSAKAAMAGSVELPTMFMVGWIAFGEKIGFVQLLCGILIIIAITITPTHRVKYRIPK